MNRLRSNPWAVLVVLCGGFFMILLDTTIVNIAIPSISDSLQASLGDILWVVNAYILVYAVLLIPAGRLGDMYGQRNLFAAGMALFVIASATCGFAQDVNQLVAARVAQGVGGALLTPQTLAILTTIFPAERRGAAFGLWGAVAGIAAITGPTLGGVLVTSWSWRWVFYVNLPIGVVALAATFLIVPNLRMGRRHGFDPVGILLVSVGLLGIVFGLIEGQRYQWSTIGAGITVPEVIVGGILIIIAFVAWEFTQREPLVPLSLFRDRNFSLMNWAGAVISIGMFGIVLLFTIYLQSVLGMSAMNAGLTMAPSSVVSLFVAPLSGRLSDKIGGKFILLAGFVLFAVGIWLSAMVATTSSTWSTFLIPLLILGVGQGCVFAPMATVALRNVEPAMAGAASGVFNTTRQVGAAIGSAAIGALLSNQLSTALHSEAVNYSVQLPELFRQRFVDALSTVAQNGLEVGRTQNVGTQLPASIPPQFKEQLIGLFQEVFNHAYVDALHATVWLPVAVLLVGACTCLLIEKLKKVSTVQALNRDTSEGIVDGAIEGRVPDLLSEG
ncbi:MAG: DHA2 family efflux MFS transporter permease subunit [Chloroflexi bacterium]|nr:DHA2 family efflux MFS transporter permease subunit [Chloroflexota bacterium]